MDLLELGIAILVGILQGIFEWLPISSEGNISILLTVLGRTPAHAVQYSLFLHLGTAFAATAYFQAEIRDLLADLPRLRDAEFDPREHIFLVLATLISGVTGLLAYEFLMQAVSELDGGLLIILIGGLLVLTGVFQRQSASQSLQTTPDSTYLDALLVGVGQGAAILPGISRSGTTVGVLLLRGYDGNTAFRLSFLLSIPAAVGAGLLVLIDGDALAGVGLLNAVSALLASAIVGYLTIGLLMRFARRVSFAAICVVLGLLAMAGGLLVVL